MNFPRIAENEISQAEVGVVDRGFVAWRVDVVDVCVCVLEMRFANQTRIDWWLNWTVM